MRINTPKFILFALCFSLALFTQAQPNNNAFKAEVSPTVNPWSNAGFYNDPNNFQFAIVTDRTGGHRDGVFETGVEKLNLLMPEFVMSVGDLIEGYVEDTVELNRQWKEFNGFIKNLQVRFFYVPGNHDISNQVMRRLWLEQFGKSYYYFIYKNVLFLAMDTNDGEGQMFSREQIEFAKAAIQKHPEVRWTLLFMHHPIWLYRDVNGFEEVEAVLKNRPYTVFAGHYHRYMHEVRNERNYYVLATTGGGSALRGPKFGEYDHVTWVTMMQDGPRFTNLKLDGILTHDVANRNTADMAQALIQGSKLNGVMLGKEVDKSKKFTAAKAYFFLENTGDSTLHFKARAFHHHHLDLTPSKLEYTMNPHSAQTIALDLKAIQSRLTSQYDPLELDWSMGYKTRLLEPTFDLKGTYTLPIDYTPAIVSFTKRPIFTDTLHVHIHQPYEGLMTLYTLDGTEPTLNSASYKPPIVLDRSATLKVRLFDAEGNMSESVSVKYEKVEPLAPVKVKPKKLQTGLKYNYYEGNFTMMPDFKTLKPIKSGLANDFDLKKIAAVKDHFALVYEGYIEVPSEAIYTFYTYSDDGSKLYIGDKLVVDNDGSHEARLRNGLVALKAGIHPIRIEYFEDFEGEALRVGYEGGGVKRGEIPFEKLKSNKK